MSDHFETETGPRERSTYSAFGDEYRGFDVKEDEAGGKGPLVLALAAGVILVFGTVVWNAYRQGTKAGPGDTPVFAADTTPYKLRPESASASDSQSEGGRLFEDATNSKTEIIPASANANSGTPKVAGEPRDIRPPEIAKEPEAKPAPKPQPPPQTQVSAPVVSEPAPSPEPVVTAPRELPPAEPQQLVSIDPNGGYLVQIMALRDLSATEKAWSQLAEANSDLFAGATMDIQRADLGAKGIFYRLRASAFGSRATADGFCSELKSRGQSCIVVAKS